MPTFLFQPGRVGRNGPQAFTYPPSGERTKQTSITFQPGLNRVSEEAYALLKKDKYYKHLVVKQALVVLSESDPEAEKAPAEDLPPELDSTDYTVDQLRNDVLPGVDRTELLTEWLTLETRTTAKNAIAERLEELAPEAMNNAG